MVLPACSTDEATAAQGEYVIRLRARGHRNPAKSLHSSRSHFPLRNLPPIDCDPGIDSGSLNPPNSEGEKQLTLPLEDWLELDLP